MRLLAIEQTRSPQGKLRLRFDSGEAMLVLPAVVADLSLRPGMDIPDAARASLEADIHEMKMNNDYQIKGRCSLYTSLFLIGMDIYFSSSLRAYVSILPSTLLSCLIILMRE